MMTKLEKKAYIKEAKELYSKEPSGHGFSHIKRVLGYAKKICAAENGNWDVVFVACLFHDVHRVMSNRSGKFVSAEESLCKVSNILSKFNISQNQLKEILYIIENHDRKNEKLQNEPIELKIVIDADALDALGRRGLARTRTYCKNHGIPLFTTQFGIDTKKYIPDINPISCVHYVHRTMIPHAQNMRTEMGKKLAATKITLLQKFVEKRMKKASKQV